MITNRHDPPVIHEDRPSENITMSHHRALDVLNGHIRNDPFDAHTP